MGICHVKPHTIEQGLHNFLDGVGGDGVASCTLLLVVEGKPLPPATHKRLVVTICGRSFRPKMFDCIRCVFVDAADFAKGALQTPCNIQIAERASRVSPDFSGFDYITSSELVRELCEAFSTMELLTVDYHILTNIDGSLRFS